MAFDIESLQQMSSAPSKGEARKQRQRIIERLAGLGVSDGFLANICGVQHARTVRRWREGNTGPQGAIARVAVDRLGPLVDHLETDLGLSDVAIKHFLTTEEVRPSEERGPELDVRWTPEYEAACHAPLVAGISSNHGLESIRERLMIRFPERYEMIAQMGQVATPEAAYHS